MIFEFTDEFVALLVLLEDGKRRNVSEIAVLLRESYIASLICGLRAARQTTANRLKNLHYTDYLAVKKDRSGNLFYKITKKGQEKIKESEKNEYLKTSINTFRELFKKFKQDEDD